MNTKVIEKTLVVGAFQCNCRILICPTTGHGLVIDPGDESDKIFESFQGITLAGGVPVQIKWILHTHAHLDHIGGTAQLKKKIDSKDTKIALHSGDENLYYLLKTQCQLFGLDYGDPTPIDYFLKDEEILHIGKLKLSVLHTPGHSPGSIGIRLHEDSATGASEAVFSGDTLFYQSVGRTDLWGANQDQMFKSIRTRLLTLDDATRVCPGHGPDTTIGQERTGNPFLI